MMVAFVLLKPNHNTIFATWDVNMICVDEDFHLVDAQSCIRQSSDMSSSSRRCLAVFDPVVRERVGGVMT
jgi:hypothetical protein